MYLRNLWILALSLQLVHGKLIQEREENVDYSKVCKQIAKSVSSAGRVYYIGKRGEYIRVVVILLIRCAGNAQYTKDVTSWSLTNVERAVCTVEPSTSKDVAKIVSIFPAPRAGSLVIKRLF